MNLKKNFMRTGILLAAATSLSGCLPALVGTAAVGGAVIATDRRATGAQADDQIMELRIKDHAMRQLLSQAQPAGFKPSISVVSYNRKVLLLGLVATEADKTLVEKIARSEPAVQTIYNYIVTPATDRTIGSIAGDTWITTKAKTALVSAPGVPSGRTKVVTYNHTAYVFGILTPAEQEAVVNAVRNISGVSQVVTLFETFPQQGV